jgi:tryptophan-rich sensory protein
MNAYSHKRDFGIAPRHTGPAAHLAIGVGLAAAAVGLAFLAAREPKPDIFDIDYNAEHAEAIGALPDTIVHAPPRPLMNLLWPPVFMALALSGLRVWSAPPSPARTRALTIWSLLQGFNAAWMTFGSRRVGGQVTAASAAIGAAVAYGLNARKVAQPLSGLAAPYVGWMGLANVLNEQLWKRRGVPVVTAH